jgi:hypothetical protein
MIIDNYIIVEGVFITMNIIKNHMWNHMSDKWFNFYIDYIYIDIENRKMNQCLQYIFMLL